jgi:hypothetical protein
MSKLNNTKLNTVFYALGMLTVLVLGVVIMPTQSYARIYGKTCNAVGCNYNFSTAPAEVTPIYSPVVTTYIPTVYSSTPAPVVKKTTSTVKKVATPKVLGASTEEDAKTLAANAVYGSDSFMPSGLLQWIFFAILILIIVILVRKIFGGEKNYHQTPLKHA